MQVPPTIRVGPLTYTVSVDETEIQLRSAEEHADLDGQCNRRSLQITLRPSLAGDRLAEVLVHEVLHALTDLTGIDLRLEADLEEDVVRRLAPALLDTLRRNPLLVDYLTSGY